MRAMLMTRIPDLPGALVSAVPCMYTMTDDHHLYVQHLYVRYNTVEVDVTLRFSLFFIYLHSFRTYFYFETFPFYKLISSSARLTLILWLVSPSITIYISLPCIYLKYIYLICSLQWFHSVLVYLKCSPPYCHYLCSPYPSCTFTLSVQP